MTHAELCPVCNGSGEVQNPNYNPNLTYPGEQLVTCHGCGGNGWVEVHENMVYPFSDSSYPYEGDTRKPNDK